MKSVVGTIQVIAHRTGCDVAQIHPWQRLEEDLDMTPLELVLVALEIEDIEGVEIDVSGMENVRRVGDLCRFFERRLHAARRDAPRLHVA
jgi:acyl carrier protein